MRYILNALNSRRTVRKLANVHAQRSFSNWPSNHALNGSLCRLQTTRAKARTVGDGAAPRILSLCVRYFKTSNSSNNDKKNTLNLMNTEPTLKHTFWTSMGIIFKSFWIGHNDPTFKWPDFLKGASQAAYIISNHLSRGEFDSLHGLVDEKAIEEIQSRYIHLSESDRQFLAVRELEDVFAQTVIWIGFQMPKEDGNARILVDIMSVLHGHHGRSKLMNMLYEDIKMDPEKYQKVAHHGSYIKEIEEKAKQMDPDPISMDSGYYSMKYRFRRELTKGVEDNWTVQQLDHFRTTDYMDRKDIVKIFKHVTALQMWNRNRGK